MLDEKKALKEIVKALNEKKAEDIEVIDITGIASFSDYFVIASANNVNQLRALQDNVDEIMYKEEHMNPKQVEGNKASTWILMDYGDIVVHLFSEEDRLFYDLERVWKDGKALNVQELLES